MDLRPASAAQPAPTSERARLERAAVQFESLFIHQMVKQMRASARTMAGEGSLLAGKGQDLLDHADMLLADQMAGQRAFGIADAILRQMLPADAALKSAAPAVALDTKSVPPTARTHPESAP